MAAVGNAGFLSNLGDVLVGGINTGVDAYFRPTDPAAQVTQTPAGLQKQGTQQSVVAGVPAWVWVAGIGGLALVVLLIVKR